MRIVRFAAIGALLVLLVLMTGCDLLGLGGANFSSDPISGHTDTGSTWTFASGYVSNSFFSSGEYDVNLYAVSPTSGSNPWDAGAYSSSADYITFTAPSSPDAVKLQFKLFGDTSANQTITYYSGGTNYIIIDGWIQLTVDETAGTATVKLDVSDSSSGIDFNGTVTVNVEPAS